MNPPLSAVAWVAREAQILLETETAAVLEKDASPARSKEGSGKTMFVTIDNVCETSEPVMFGKSNALNSQQTQQEYCQQQMLTV
eukprot:214578-Amphidinium_carterae.1